jgi:hypothetical protein
MRGRNISGWSVKYSHKAEVAVLGAPAIKNIDGLDAMKLLTLRDLPTIFLAT